MGRRISWRRLAFACRLSGVMLYSVGPISAAEQDVDRSRQSEKVVVANRADGGLYSHAGPDGAPAGYGIEACQHIVEAVGRPVSPTCLEMTAENRQKALVEGRVDAATLQRRDIVSFSLPIFGTGIGATPSANAPRHPPDVLGSGSSLAAPPQALRRETSGMRSGASAETGLEGSVARFGGAAEIVVIDDHAAGVVSGALDANSADRALPRGQVRQTEGPDRFVLLNGLLTHEDYAIAKPRSNEDVGLIADRTLGHSFGSPEFASLFDEYSGTP